MKRRVFLVIVAILVMFSLYLSLIYAPRERVMGDVQRIFYFHMPLAWNALLAFSIAFVNCIRYLRKRNISYDQLSSSSVEIGVFFTTMVLITGSIWARSAWGTYWVWEPRLTTAFVLWLMYLFYIILRRNIEDRDRARIISSVYGIIAFINVPVVFMSIRWWRTQHPVLIEMGRIKMAPPMVLTLLFSLVAFTLFHILWLLQRTKLTQLRDRIDLLKENIKEEFI